MDEPEISLRANLQKKIIKVYENIGKNNQLIIATHSPHILGNMEAKQLRIKKDNDSRKECRTLKNCAQMQFFFYSQYDLFGKFYDKIE